MRKNNPGSLLVLATVLIVILPSLELRAATVDKSSSVASQGSATRWCVQVKKIDAADINLAPSFQIAIYESLLEELGEDKQFRGVLRDGDRNAGDIASLLILKTTVEKYAAGSETQRAVTTVSGATKLTVRSQLSTRDGTIILDRTVHGNVRFLGSNLKATHNLAHNVAKTIKQSSLPQVPAVSSYGASSSQSDSETVVVEMS
jgi:hypothetical protein